MIVRPATREDMIAYYGDVGRAPTIQALCLEVDGEILGIGGVEYARGVITGFVDIEPEGRAHKAAIHRAALRFMQMMRQKGVKWITIRRDLDEPRAPHWLERLGFKPVDDEGIFWRWRH